MNSYQKVLVTGGAGYIGSVLVAELLRQGYGVRVIDNLSWGGESLLPFFNHPSFEFYQGDIRIEQDVRNALQGIDSIIHLAAIVGDPACKKEPEVAQDTNLKASIQLFESAIKHNVSRFIFASTCSNYGRMSHDQLQYCTEDSPLKPVSLYAELKVSFEKYLLGSHSDICVTSLRFATAYGLSPRMRFDLTVNEFVRDAVYGKKLEIFGEHFWRPYCHTKDLARCCVQILQAPQQSINRQAFNVGDDLENYQKKTLAGYIQDHIKDFKVTYIKKDEDPRDYRVSFQKIKDLGFTITKRLPDGIQEIIAALNDGITKEPYSKKYSNI